jgi:[protein-PII] uridylyltransferase
MNGETFDRSAIVAGCRSRLHSGQTTICERYLSEGDAARLLRERCQLADEILCDLWRTLALPVSLALVAVGGYPCLRR